MTDAYLRPAIQLDRTAVADEIYERLADSIPGWTAAPASVETYLVEAFSEWIAQLLEQGSEVGDYIYRRLGTWLFRYPPREATQATGTSTWTFVSGDEYLIAAGTPLTLLGPDGSRVDFQVRVDVLKPAGQLSTGIGEVEIIATDPGLAGTGLQAGAQLEQPLTAIDTITVEGSTVGGEDAEGDAEYLDRLKAYLANRQDTLVLPRNFEIDAVISNPLIDRALALNGFNPADGTSGNGGMIAIAVIDANGADPGSAVRDDGEARQQAMSVAGLTVNWIAPTYTPLAIVFAAKSYAEFDPADVEARAEQAVADWLSPANWGLPPFGDQRRWIDTPTVRFRDLVAVVEGVEGLDYTTSVTLNGGTADVAMTGPAALPAPAPTSTVAGTVTAP